MSKKTITFELESPINYTSKKSGLIECNFIELVEPTGKESSLCCAIESIIQKGIMSMAEMFKGSEISESKPENSEEKDPEGMLAVMASSGVDMEKIVLLYRDLFKTVAFMGGEKEITVPRMDDMSHKDFRKMIGVYTVNFIMS